VLFGVGSRWGVADAVPNRLRHRARTADFSAWVTTFSALARDAQMESCS
jgi:hypothetical protein